MIEFAGRVRDVRCVTARNIAGPSHDTTTVMLQFESGATGPTFCSVATATPMIENGTDPSSIQAVSRACTWPSRRCWTAPKDLKIAPCTIP